LSKTQLGAGALPAGIVPAAALASGASESNLSARPCFLAHKNGSNQTSVANTTYTKITFTTEDWDIGSHYDAANSRFQPSVAGKYRLTAVVNFSTGLADAGQYIVAIYKNGTLHRLIGGIQAGGSTQSIQPNGSCIVDANGSTDYFEVYAYGQTGSSLTIEGSASTTYFCGEKI
jgi:hypothetical protein